MLAAMRASSACVLLLTSGCFSGADIDLAESSSQATTGESLGSTGLNPTTGLDLTSTSTGMSTGPGMDTGAGTTDIGTQESGGSESSGEPPASTPGLRAEYYRTYIDPVIDRVDAAIDFDWGDGPPAKGLGVNRFSIRWTGQLVPASTGPHTIISETDDGVRVWLGDKLVIDDWNGHFVTRNEATVDLVVDVPVAIRVEYFELDLGASARLKWSSPTLTEEVIPEANLIAAEVPSGLPPPKPPYTNPVEAFDCPDPGVFALDMPDGPHFYKLCTGGKFPIRHSRDLVLWNDTGAVVLPNGKPTWAANGGRNWAPELHRVGDKFIVYFTTVNGANVLSIGAAHATDPLGPYTETDGPLVQHPQGVIDATYFYSGGKPYLIYKIDGNSQGKPTPMLIRELRADGLEFANGSAEVQLLVNQGGTWEGGVVEAPWVVKRDGFHYMFYSGNVYDHRYRTGVARSKNLMGPYEKLGPPILGNNERWVGPGHGTVISVQGLDYFVYHAWTNAGNGTHDDAKGRHVLVDRVVYEGGWPRIHDGTPSRNKQLWPGVP